MLVKGDDLAVPGKKQKNVLGSRAMKLLNQQQPSNIQIYMGGGN